MWIKRIVVRGFGGLPAGVSLELSPGLNLILAPNEAGKTTLAEFVTCLFYGFGKRKGGVHPFAPWQGGEVGGEIDYLLRDGGRFTLRRHLVKSGEKTSLADEAGREVNLAAGQPGELHLGMGRGVFLTVSRLGLDDLQGAFSGQIPKDKKEAEEQLKGYFFQEAATRGEVVNPVRVKQDWDNRAQALFSTDRRRGKADQALLEKIGQAKDALAQARAQEEQAQRLSAEMEETGKKTVELKKSRQAAAQEAEEARGRLELAKEAARKQEIESEISQLVAQGLADEPTEQRARDLSGQIQGAEKRAQAAGRRAEQSQAEVKEFCPGRDPAQWDQAIKNTAALFSGLKLRRQETDVRLKTLDEQKKSLESKWGLTASALAGLDADMPITLGALQKEMSQAQEAADEARRRMADLEDQTPRPGWVLPLGLACLVLGLGLLAWRFLGTAGFGALVAGLILALAGAGLFVWGMAGRRKAHARKAGDDKLQELVKREQELKERMGGLLYQLNLPPESLDPAGLAEARAQAVSLETQARELAQEQARLQEESAALAAGAVRDWAMQPGGDMEAGLAQARERCDKAMSAAREVMRLSKEAQEETLRAEELRAELGKLFESAGLAGLEALAQARGRAKKVAELTAKLEEVKKRLGPEADQGESLDPQACGQKLEQAQAKLNNIDAELREISQGQGRLEMSLASLTQALSPEQAKAHLEELERGRLALARRHDTLVLGGALLQRAMEEFRLQAQPRLLKIAGDYLSRATGGAYDWLGSDLFTSDRSKEPRLSARAGLGAGEHEAEALSRGTRDQLYLCLRLALADEITRQGEPIPLILDDPLVNFDDLRLAASLGLFGELAGKRQIIFLTCHEEQARLLQKAGDCRMLEIK